MQPIISFQNVFKQFRDQNVLKGINFNIYQGELFGLIGKSGAGKTTLLRSLIGFYKVDSGKILYKGKEVTHNLKEIKQLFGFGTQDNCFYQELTCAENMRYFGKLYRLPKKRIEQNIERLLKLVGLWEFKNQIANEMSGGMQRRLDLACALIHDPKILILDEPTTGLDPTLRRSMWELIERINLLGITIIISSHLLEEIEQICTKVAMIKSGRILVTGSPDQLKELYSKNEEIHLETFPGRYNIIIATLIKQGAKISYTRQEGHKIVLYVPQAEKALHQILHVLEELNESLLDVDVNKPSLSEVFEAFTGGK